MEFNIYSINDIKWKKAFDAIPAEQKDINFMQAWYETWLEHESAEAYCIHFNEDGYHFLYPFLKRKIQKFDLTDDYYDVQSAYGYGGVIVSHPNIPEEIGRRFDNLTTEWLYDNRVIAEFIREHPLLDSFKRQADYQTVRRNVYVETSHSYRIPDKQARQNVARAFSQNAEILYDEDCRHLGDFIDLYRETSHRLNVHPYYNFANDYFMKVKKLLGDHCRLIHIIKEGLIIASGLYMLYNGRANLHLTASRTAYQVLRSNDLLYHAVIEYSIKNGVKILNVGGGVSNHPDDSLFRFKIKYASMIRDVKVGKNIINPDVYNNLNRIWELRYPNLVSKYDSYFLRYRQEA